MANRFYEPYINAYEFQFPEMIAQDIVDILFEIRMRVGRPMTLTKNKDGVVFHPNGDAVKANSGSHSDFSYHIAGINHEESKKQNRVVYAPDAKGRAQDFDFYPYHGGMKEFLEIHLMIREMGVGGFGTYPNWNRMGFHIDNRSEVLCWFAEKGNAGRQVYQYNTDLDYLVRLWNA